MNYAFYGVCLHFFFFSGYIADREVERFTGEKEFCISLGKEAPKSIVVTISVFTLLPHQYPAVSAAIFTVHLAFRWTIFTQHVPGFSLGVYLNYHFKDPKTCYYNALGKKALV